MELAAREFIEKHRKNLFFTAEQKGATDFQILRKYLFWRVMSVCFALYMSYAHFFQFYPLTDKWYMLCFGFLFFAAGCHAAWCWWKANKIRCALEDSLLEQFNDCDPIKRPLGE